jgi:hypothetical protein
MSTRWKEMSDLICYPTQDRKGLRRSRSQSFHDLIRPEDPSLVETSCLRASAYVRQRLSQLHTVQDARQNFGHRVANFGMTGGDCGKILISGA